MKTSSPKRRVRSPAATPSQSSASSAATPVNRKSLKTKLPSPLKINLQIPMLTRQDSSLQERMLRKFRECQQQSVVSRHGLDTGDLLKEKEQLEQELKELRRRNIELRTEQRSAFCEKYTKEEPKGNVRKSSDPLVEVMAHLRRQLIEICNKHQYSL